MKTITKIFSMVVLSALMAMTTTSCNSTSKSEAEGDATTGFVTVKDGTFYVDSVPYHYVGTNFWFGAILASEGRGGDRARLTRELDLLQEVGINNLRVLVGGDGDESMASHIRPVLQTAPGVYNDTILQGLDYLLVELEKRNMKVVLYLNNAWEWSGGYGTYLEWAGKGKAPDPLSTSYPEYCKFVSQFVSCDSAKNMSYDHAKFMVGRVNSITGKPYTESPAIMAWQVANEPRAFNADPVVKKNFAEFVRHTAQVIKSIDKNHLVSTGSEGLHGCEEDLELWNEIHRYPEIDYANIHIWPYNWSWISKETVKDSVEVACRNTEEYIKKHYDKLKSAGKPIVLEEFGYPRDGFVFTPGSPTEGRDTYYKYVFSIIRDTGMIAGCNFWAWGGYADPKHEMWQEGDDYTGDPAQEAQGLNSVFANDESTLAIIKDMAKSISEF